MDNIVAVLLDAIPRMLNVIWSILCAPIYYLMSLFYNVFVMIPQINILKDLKIEDIYQRITMIIVIVMAFYITFEVVKYVVQPDTITDKEKGTSKMALRIVFVILMLAFIPRIFTIAYDLQGRIINSDIIAKVLLGVKEDSNSIFSSRGSEFSADVFGLFYGLNTEACPLDSSGEIDGSDLKNIDKVTCETAKKAVDFNLELLRGGWTDNPIGHSIMGPISALTRNFGLSWTVSSKDTDGDGKKDIEYVIDFNGFIALCVGIFILWTLMVYGIEVAKRYFQLIYLQIIAPIAIMSYLSPKKDGVFQKWTKQCFTTYLDLFIRLSIINFILLITSLLNDAFFNTSNLIDAYSKDFGVIPKIEVLSWVYIFLIIGLFTFAKKAPKMLQELFPSGGAASSGFGLWDTTKSVVGGTSRAIGGVVGAYTGIRTAHNSNHLKTKQDRFLAGAKGAFAGAKAGFSKGGNIKKARAAATGSIHKDEDTAVSGGSVFGATFQGNKYAQESKGYDREKKRLEDVAKVKDEGKKLGSGHGLMKQTASTLSELEHRNISDADSRGAWNKSMEKTLSDLSVNKNAQEAKTRIAADTHTLYDTERQKIENEARINTEVAQNALDAARTQRQTAVDTLNSYETFVGPLTEEQIAERQNAQKIKDETDQQIKSLKEQIQEIETTKEKKIKQTDQEEQDLIKVMHSKIVETTTDANGNVIETLADAAILTQMENTYKQGYTDSVGTYITPDGKEMTIYSNEKEARIVAAERARESGRTVEEELQDVHANHIDLYTYVKNIGKIQDSANTKISDMSIDPNVRKAKANADASGKSGS